MISVTTEYWYTSIKSFDCTCVCVGESDYYNGYLYLFVDFREVQKRMREPVPQSEVQ